MRKRHRSIQVQAPQSATTTHLSHDGRGIAHLDGKIVFIQGALAEEEVIFRPTRTKSQYSEGVLLEVLTPSPTRVAPQCAHYALCGGCSLQHLDAAVQIHEKQLLVLNLLERVGHVTALHTLPPLTGPTWHYRHKARLSVRYVEKKQQTLVGFRERNNPRFITEINGCLVLHEKVDAHISHLRKFMDSLAVKDTIAQIEVAAGDEDIALIFRNLKPLIPADEEKLRELGQQTGFRIYLQPAGPDSVTLFYPEDAPEYLEYALPDENIRFQFKPTDFTQVNSALNRLMVRQALDLLELQPEDTLLDLFCGLGNFSLPAARHCAQVVGIEGSADMVARAQMNAQANEIGNVAFYHEDLSKEAALARLDAYQFTHLLLDPPRTGAAEIVQAVGRWLPKRILYVSCNPATLARDVGILVNQHQYVLQSVGVMDMFPQTTHVESMAVLVRE